MSAWKHSPNVSTVEHLQLPHQPSIHIISSSFHLINAKFSAVQYTVTTATHIIQHHRIYSQSHQHSSPNHFDTSVMSIYSYQQQPQLWPVNPIRNLPHSRIYQMSICSTKYCDTSVMFTMSAVYSHNCNTTSPQLPHATPQIHLLAGGYAAFLMGSSLDLLWDTWASLSRVFLWRAPIRKTLMGARILDTFTKDILRLNWFRPTAWVQIYLANYILQTTIQFQDKWKD